jgi:hypothetical protein
MRRTQRGTRRVFTITWVVLALMLGILGLRYRKSHIAAHAGAHGQQAQPGGNTEPSRAPVPDKPANNRNG